MRSHIFGFHVIDFLRTSRAACRPGGGEHSTHSVRVSAVSGRLTGWTTSAALVLGIAVLTAWFAQRDLAQADRNAAHEKVHRLEERVLHYTNEARKTNGLPALEGSGPLAALARTHSANMCRSRTFLHESPVFPKGWNTLAERLNRAKVRSGGENIGYQTMRPDGDAWARQMVEGWMKGPQHRRNILNPDWRYLGVGVSRCGNDIGYVTQVFSGELGRTL